MDSSTPTRAGVLGRMVLPFALVPPIMIMLAMRDHAEAYRLNPAAANWEWIALVVFAAEIASVGLVAGMLRLTTPSDRLPPATGRAWMLAARAASPLWASAIVLAVPSLAALIVAHLLAHAVALRTLYRDIRNEWQLGPGVQALHLTYIVYSIPVVLWIPIFVMIFVSLSQGG
ncbi:MAG TPA: hypothetical protein VJ673_17875 [Aromatoleum sp.]|uniref:hypothetical protein n=1 Tax=Aromatoleum sp. TaxID=2307007 RepID=UPI002B465A00|nr:hypothetical protein [Aromatoleum sp.]HJV27563.1 hypothetical protein [Aromatoleum sp.]